MIVIKVGCIFLVIDIVIVFEDSIFVGVKILKYVIFISV